MPGERALAVRRQDEERELIGRSRRTADDGQAVIGADRERIGQLHDRLRRILALGGERIGAIGQEDIGRSLRDQIAIDRAALRRAGGLVGPPVSCSALLSSTAKAPALIFSALRKTSQA